MDGDVDELASWWSGAQELVRQLGVPMFRGNVTGGAVVDLDLSTAAEAFAALLDILEPRYCLWEPETDGDGQVVNYRISLLFAGATWQVLEIGIPVSEDDEADDGYDSGDAYAPVDDEGDGSQPVVLARIEELIAEMVEALVEETSVSTSHTIRVLTGVAEERIRKKVTDEPAEVQRAFRRAQFELGLTVRRDLEIGLKRRHGGLIRRDAREYAEQILAEEPGLTTASRTSRRDAVYRYMKGIDPECVTRESSVVVDEEVALLAARGQAGLFG